MFSQTLENIIPKYCEKCGKEYAQQDVVVMPENIPNPGQVFNVRCSCSRCKNVVVMKIAIRPDMGVAGIKNIGKVFNEDRVLNQEMYKDDPLVMDDLLIFYEYLEQLKPITLIQKSN